MIMSDLAMIGLRFRAIIFISALMFFGSEAVASEDVYGRRHSVQDVQLYRQACERGDMAGCAAQAYLYDNADGVKRDVALAFKLYEKACKANVAAGCAGLGWLYEEGKIVPKNIEKALKLANDSCKQGDERACCNLAIYYDNGNYVQQDFVKAKTLYEKSCQNKFGKACSNLAVFYQEGQGVKKDPEKAQQLLSQACDYGNVFGCVLLLQGDAERDAPGGRLSKLNRNYSRIAEQVLTDCKSDNDANHGCDAITHMCSEGLASDKNCYEAGMFFSAKCKQGSKEDCERYKSAHWFLNQD